MSGGDRGGQAPYHWQAAVQRLTCFGPMETAMTSPATPASFIFTAAAQTRTRRRRRRHRRGTADGETPPLFSSSPPLPRRPPSLACPRVGQQTFLRGNLAEGVHGHLDLRDVHPLPVRRHARLHRVVDHALHCHHHPQLAGGGHPSAGMAEVRVERSVEGGHSVCIRAVSASARRVCEEEEEGRGGWRVEVSEARRRVGRVQRLSDSASELNGAESRRL